MEIEKQFLDERKFSASRIILPNNKVIYIGSLFDAQSLQELYEREIAFVLTVAEISPFSSENMNKTNLYHLQISIPDHPSVEIFKFLQVCFDFLDDSLKDSLITLVHCMSGISRSVTICALYIMSRFGMDDDQVLHYIRQFRPQANPNIGFRHQLMLFQRSGRDIPKAAELFRLDNAGSGITSSIIKQRDAANEFHRIVDEYEIVIKNCASPSLEDLNAWLLSLEVTRNNALAIGEPGKKLLSDKVFDMVVKSARSKCERLERVSCYCNVTLQL